MILKIVDRGIIKMGKCKKKKMKGKKKVQSVNK
jgi:hypothetical protein